ncbi:MAG: hypothetical protein Pg6C_04720 [Treponemataceae bacterium]|nr:MAG: hypothetical protein Pg6C_04720 [Treponemataceae bacterium]
MAKTIKFNLILDNKPVRDLDGLRDNFNIEDLLGAYRNGSLKRWLESRDLARETAALDAITGDDLSAARELCRVFHGDCTTEQLEAAVYPFKFRQKEAEQLRQYKNLKEQKDEVIRAYHEGYVNLLKELEEKGDDYAFVKPGVAELFRRYVGLYRLDAWVFYQRFITAHPLVILAMLANADTRPIIAKKPEDIFSDLNIPALTSLRVRQSDVNAFFKKWEKDNNQPGISTVSGRSENETLRNRNQQILMLGCSDNPALNGTVLNSSQLEANYYPYTFVPLADITTPLPNHVKTFAGITEGYWKDIQPQGKQFLIIKMESGNFVRSAGKNGEELKAEDVNGTFPILDGIDYKSNNAGHQLVYMEV